MVIKQEFTFPSSDGVHTVAAAWWRPEGPPRGMVQLVHGISEHIGRYDSFARFLAEHGFAVVGHDHLGHGRTARNPSEFGWFADRDGWKHVVKDVRALRERVGAEYPGLPCFLLGHSMGNCDSPSPKRSFAPNHRPVSSRRSWISWMPGSTESSRWE